MKIKIKVTPRAKANKIIGWQGDALRVRLTAPPVDGKANEALIKFLAGEWKISQSSVKILKGESGREKLVEIPDIKLKQSSFAAELSG